MRRIGLALITILTLTVATPRAAAAAQLVTTYQVGANPFGMVSDPTDGRVYVANIGVRTIHGTGSISVIDPGTGNVTDQDTSKPSGLLALDAGGRRLYASNYEPSNGGSPSLDVIDLNTGRWLTTLAVGGLGLAVDTTRGRAFVAGGRYLAAVDTTTFSIDVRSAPFPESWFGVATDPARGRVYVTNIDASHPSLVVLDANDLHTIADVSLPSVARYALAVDNASGSVYVAGANASGLGSTISVIDGTTFAMRTASLPLVFAAGIALAPETHRVFVTDFEGKQLLVLDDATLMSVEPTIQLPWRPYFATFARDGRLYVGGSSTSIVGALDVSLPTIPVNRPPTIVTVTVTPSGAETNDMITAIVQAYDLDGDAITLGYQWSVNKVDRPGETDPSLDLSKAGNGDRNDIICLTVSASDGELNSTLFWCPLFVRDSAPVALISLDSISPATGSVLRATASATDVDGDAITYGFTWRVNGIAVRSTTSSNSQDALDLAVAGNGDSGDVVTVAVVASDDLRSSAPATASATVVNSAPTVSVVLNDTTARKKDVIVATLTAQDPDADALTYAYVWRVGGVVKLTTTGTSATTSELDLRAAGAHIGDVITVDVTASDGVATAAASASGAVTPAGH